MDLRFEVVIRNKVILEGASSCRFLDEKNYLKSELVSWKILISCWSPALQGKTARVPCFGCLCLFTRPPII